jgi:hypothetical protein
MHGRSSRQLVGLGLLWVIGGCSQEAKVLALDDAGSYEDLKTEWRADLSDASRTDRYTHPSCNDVLSATSTKITAGVPVTGKLLYAGARGWYWLDHPCPGSDCTFTLTYSAGPNCPSNLQFMYTLHFNDGEDFFSFPKNSQPGMSGSYGPPNQCLFARQEDGNEAYCLSVSDSGSDGWSSECAYTFTVSKPTMGCSSPCLMVGSYCSAM